MQKEQMKVNQKEMDRLEHLGIIQKGLTSYSSPVVLVKRKKTETLTTRLKTLLIKLSEYTVDLKYQKGSEMHTSDALSRLHI